MYPDNIFGWETDKSNWQLGTGWDIQTGSNDCEYQSGVNSSLIYDFSVNPSATLIADANYYVEFDILIIFTDAILSAVQVYLGGTLIKTLRNGDDGNIIIEDPDSDTAATNQQLEFRIVNADPAGNDDVTISNVIVCQLWASSSSSSSSKSSSSSSTLPFTPYSETEWYKKIAQYCDNTKRYIPYADKYMYEAINVVTDIQSHHSDLMRDIALDLLKLVKEAYRSQREFFATYSVMIRLNQAMNDLVIKHITSDLASYVNSINWDSKYKGRVPYYWAQFSEQAGYDISEWDIEVISS